MHIIFVCSLILLCAFDLLYAFDTRQSLAKKGKFFIHTLHSASFFPSTVPVKWSATLKNRPALPQWLQLVPSSHPAISFLAGTPVTPLRQITVHVMAKRLDTFEIRQQYIVINLANDANYEKYTRQVLEIHVKNYNAEEILSDRNGHIGRLELAAKNTFRGRNVNPYIFRIEPELTVPAEKAHLFRDHKIGSIISIGTQKGFSANTHQMIRSLRESPSSCRKNSQIVLNKQFAPEFDVDWCRAFSHNFTSIVDDVSFGSGEVTTTKITATEEVFVAATPEQPLRDVASLENRFSFLESVLVFPMIAVLCIILILILSLIFFGKREGQQWRDYKTPKDQLEEYVSVRESQRHLRELSVQRQLLLMTSDRDQSIAPSGIHSFLQPKNKAPTVVNNSPGRFSKSASKLNEHGTEETMELLPTESVPIGKQTVAEAARQCGSSLHLYRNPLESEEEANDSDSLEEKEMGV